MDWMEQKIDICNQKKVTILRLVLRQNGMVDGGLGKVFKKFE
jgi:hypothetical protein